MPGLGRRILYDARDKLYSARRRLPETTLTGSKLWMPGPRLDQGETPRCTAYAWRAWLNCEPVPDPPDSPPDTATIYVNEQQGDGFSHASPLPDDSDATGGSTVRAGADWLLKQRRIGEYLWARNTHDMGQWILSRGPMVCGSDWYGGMFEPDRFGFVKPTGTVAGGHAYLCIGYSSRRGVFLFQNSWGPAWGTHGLFRMLAEDVEKLLEADGECVGAVEVAA